MNPYLTEAIKAVPSVKYALGVTGIAAAVAIALGFFKDEKIAVIGVIIMIALMFVLVIFSHSVKDLPGIRWLAAVLAWAITIVFIVALICVFTSFAFGVPEKLAAYLWTPPTQQLQPGYINVGTDTDKPLEEIVQAVARSRNVTIVFSQNCDQSVRTAQIEAGEHEGNNIKEFLENLKQRVKGNAINFSVRQEGERRYEILCL